MIEEAYEAVAAAQKPEDKNFCEELGDVLLQIFLNAQIANEKKLFDIENIFNSINNKMISRHPHVFSPTGEKLNSSDEVLIQWEINKSNEKKESATSSSLLAKSLQKISLPTLNYATEISKAAGKVGFCWPTLKQVFNDIELEVLELKKEIETENLEVDKISDEVGDIIFSIANFVNFLKQYKNVSLDLDLIARQAIEKFSNRFQEMEKIFLEKGTVLTEDLAKQISLERWNDLWNEAKKRRYR